MPKLLGNAKYDQAEIERLISDIDAADKRLATLRSQHMNACKTPRKKIKQVMLQAKDSGVPLDAFRALVAEHRDRRRIRERIGKLEDDAADAYEQIRPALGDFETTPLGAAAARRAKGDEALQGLSA